MLGRGLSLVNDVDREWKIDQLLFGEETTLLADSGEKLCQLLEGFGQMCRRRNLSVNGNLIKIMKCTKFVGGRRMAVGLNWKLLDVECFEYLGSKTTVDGGIETGEI